MDRPVDSDRREVREIKGRVVFAARPGTIESVPFVLAGVAVGDLVLVPDSSESRTFGAELAEGNPLELVAVDPKGRLTCTVLVHRYRTDPHELHVTDPGFFHLRNDRSAFRVPMAVPVTVVVVTETATESVAGTSIDLSSAGLSAQVDLSCEPGAPLFVSIHLPDGNLLAVGTLVGAVDHRIRVRFTQVDPAGAGRLASHLRRAEIEQMRTGEAA
jgi:hypothetical protein